MSNQRFTSIKNDFCLVFDKNGEIVEVADDDQIKFKGYNFMSLEEIKKIDKTRSIDLIGVVCQVDPINSCQLKSGQVKDKRMVSICDESGFIIQACFWVE